MSCCFAVLLFGFVVLFCFLLTRMEFSLGPWGRTVTLLRNIYSCFVFSFLLLLHLQSACGEPILLSPLMLPNFWDLASVEREAERKDLWGSCLKTQSEFLILSIVWLQMHSLNLSGPLLTKKKIGRTRSQSVSPDSLSASECGLAHCGWPNSSYSRDGQVGPGQTFSSPHFLSTPIPSWFPAVEAFGQVSKALHSPVRQQKEKKGQCLPQYSFCLWVTKCFTLLR